MKLIGQYDSPYVRRVAITMCLQNLAFEHLPWSIGKDQAQLAAINPLGTVPVLVLDDGEVLVDSSAILDHVGALIPDRRVRAFVVLALGVADKARMIAMERVFRPADKRHPPLVERFRTQLLATCAVLERQLPAQLPDPLTQAEITLGCALTYAREAAGVQLDAFPALRDRFAQITSQPVFREVYQAFDAPAV